MGIMEEGRADFTVQIPLLNEILEAVRELGRHLDQLGPNCRQNYYLKDACTLKGLNYSTARAQPHLQPNGGVPDLVLAGRKAWTRETVLAWVHQSDDEIRGISRGDPQAN